LRPRPRPENIPPVEAQKPVESKPTNLESKPVTLEIKQQHVPVSAEAPAVSVEATVAPVTTPTAQPVQERPERPRTDQPPRPVRPPERSGPRPDRTERSATGAPPKLGQQSQNRPYTPRPGQSPGRPGDRPTGPKPASQGQRPGGGFGGAPRPGGGFNKPGGFQKKDGPPQGGFGARPRPGGSFGAAARPGGVKKDGVKGAELSKDDRKQAWKKNEQHSAKSKTSKDAVNKKENQHFLDKSTGQGRRGGSRGKTDRSAVKRIMPKTVLPVITQITVAHEITVRDLAEKLYKSNADIIKILMKKGLMVTANQTIDYETAEFVAESFDVLVEEYKEVDVFEEAFAEKPEDDSDLITRPPVVVVMGHVDHGKTSLLDVIRDASVRHTEAGGITQHIGAYSVTIHNKPITFLDTPGHEAFTAMRMRGAQVTDIAILVVAANDGVMPQTVEAINHAKAAGVDIIVAINKVDLPSANPDRVKQELTEYGLVVEDWGGDTIAVPVSALQKTGIEQLLEMIIIVAEMKELRANPNKAARGSIIEAKLDKGRGPVATVLVQDGTLRVGDPIVAGSCFGRIRAMTDDKGHSLKEAGPSVPVEIIGLSEVPLSGDMFYVAGHDRQARQLSESVIAKGRESMIKSSATKVSLDDLFNQIKAGNVKDLNVVVKADVQGSVEALKTSLDKLSNDQVRVRVIHGGVGAVTESDVMLASASNAIIIGFNVRPDTMAKSIAETEKVDIRLYRVIYSAIDDITAAMKGMLDPEFVEKTLGQAEIRQIFRASNVGTIGGSYVLDGKITRNAKVRIVRDGRVVYDGTLDTLRRFKEDVREVAAGYECGLLFHRFNDIKEGDRVESYIMEEIPR
jgi:translation initiation factor IF-2